MSVEYPDDLNPFDDEETEEETKAAEPSPSRSMRGSVPSVSVPPVIVSHVDDDDPIDNDNVVEIEKNVNENDEPEKKGEKGDVGQAREDVVVPSVSVPVDVTVEVTSEDDNVHAKVCEKEAPSPFDPPPRPPQPKMPVPRIESYDKALNPFGDDDDDDDCRDKGKAQVVAVETRPPPVPKSSPRRYKKKAPAPPPPTPPKAVEEERPTSRISNGSLDSIGSGTPLQKKKPAPNAPIPPKRVFPDGFKDKLSKELQDVDVKLEQLSRQRDAIKGQLSFFGIDDADLQDNDAPAGEESRDHDGGGVVVVDDSKIDQGHCEGDEKDADEKGGAAGVASGDTATPKEAKEEVEEEVDSRDTALVLDKLTQLASIGEEIEDLTWRRKEVAFDLEDFALNEEHAELDHRIRVIQARPTCVVSPEEKAEEAELIHRLMQVVKRRDELVEKMEADRNLRRALMIVVDDDTLHHPSGGLGRFSSSSSSSLLAGAASASPSTSPAAGDKGKRKYKLPKLKSKTLRRIRDKVVLHHHHHHGSGATAAPTTTEDDSKRRSSKKS
ncbi:unnamed protein product [Notodromas monacha]|uniref:BMERB domain-containing protein n=1 Tax=Notodromas monacha TaxID=399045 RepID=A0A7R9BDP0_9CRUS|nr:unnamed protein product [Notodromas monacha]CAG0913481.1 unnamed protein product [Notodromas monacha]